MIIKKETKLVSYVETKPLIIRLPALHIPVHYLKLTGILVLSSILFFLTSYSSPVTIQEYEPQGGIIEVCELRVPEKAFGVPLNDKVIAITEIISNNKVLDFICYNKVLERAYSVQKETGLSVATILAQKGLESNFSQSKFSSRTKNLSNIKCTSKECRKYNIKGLRKRGDVGSETKHCIQLYDDGPNDRYVKHEYYWQGWEQYKGLIKRVYGKAASKETVRAEAQALKARGFATDPNYANKIVSIATKNNLLKLQEYIDLGYTITTSGGKYVLLQQ